MKESQSIDLNSSNIVRRESRRDENSRAIFVALRPKIGSFARRVWDPSAQRKTQLAQTQQLPPVLIENRLCKIQ
jgi:hypothetical protein